MFKDGEVVVHVVRASHWSGVVREVLDEHWPVIWVSNLYGAPQGHAEIWSARLVRELLGCPSAIDGGVGRSCSRRG